METLSAAASLPFTWNRRAAARQARLSRVQAALGPDFRGRHAASEKIVTLLDAVLEPGDRVCLEGNNQKQADFLAKALTQVDAQRVHGLHMVQSVLSLPEHLDIFESGIASKLDFSFSRPAGRAFGAVHRAGPHPGRSHPHLP